MRLGDAQVRLAESAVIDAAQRLRVLGVAEDVARLVAHPEASSRPLDETDALTAYTIVAPFDGTVIARDPSAVTSGRVAAGDMLLTLADLSTVLVAARVPESDLAVLPIMNGGTVRLTAAAYPGPDLRGDPPVDRLAGRPEHRPSPAGPTANPDGLLKLACSCGYTSTARHREALTVPEAAGRRGRGPPGPSSSPPGPTT
jgi:hypothetical protein